jgi:hypothetical protein
MVATVVPGVVDITREMHSSPPQLQAQELQDLPDKAIMEAITTAAEVTVLLVEAVVEPELLVVMLDSSKEVQAAPALSIPLQGAL